MATAITKKDEIRFIHNLSKKDLFNKPLSFDDVINALINNDLMLEVTSDESTVVIDKENIEEIEKTIPFLLKIADRPKSFITLHEEKVPVETAKRINHKAIMKLSRDSNDWHARTLLSIKPKNITADINEETFNIYENRFVITLVDKIANLLRDAKAHYQMQKRAYENEKIGLKIKQYFHSSENFVFLNQINKSNEKYNEEQDIIGNLNNLLEKIEMLDRKIKIFTNSKFYQSLRKCRRVKNPIMKTNILMFSPEYNAAYKLWNNLITQQIEQSLNVEEKYDCTNSFLLYSLLNFIAVFKDMGFKETNNASFTWNFEEQKLAFNKEFILKNNIDEIRFSFDKNKFVFRYLVHENGRNNYKSINIHSDFADFESMPRSDADIYTKDLLNGLVLPSKKNKFDELSAQYCLISTDLMRTEEENPLSEKIYKRLASFGDSLSCEENTDDIKNWLDYKTGFLNITPGSLKTNFLRLERFINTNLIRSRDPNTFAIKCPICGGTHIETLENNNHKGHKTQTYLCRDCKRLYSYNYCSNCDSPLIWVKYSDEKFLDDPDVISGDFNNSLINNKLSKLEVVLGSYSITNFDLVNESGNYKLKTVCPKCGKQLGIK